MLAEVGNASMSRRSEAVSDNSLDLDWSRSSDPHVPTPLL
uniref:Uncharacterized protein n=1 Tax=uncultured bacterium A1Q1_fos_600 TaxID=1256587 RepID=L7VY99_9BACT|nr:hypothetical protein [uncultured bacterium A1Q1_fos_600]